MTHSVQKCLDYASPPARLSRLAIVAMGLGVASLATFPVPILALLGLFVGLIAAARIRRDPGRLGGAGFARAAVKCSLISVALAAFSWLLLPDLFGCGCGGSRELSNRSYCSANLRGIVQAMNVYAADSGARFPIVAYAPYSASLNAPVAGAAQPTVGATLASYYRAPWPQAGSIPASMWMLVLKDQVTPKQFICKSDPVAASTPAARADAAGNCYDNFQGGSQLSYSFAYPWNARGQVGPWWTALDDSSLPIASDMAPASGTGSNPASLTNPPTKPTSPKAWNSNNHQRDGQNVAFSDAHVEFTRSPDVGQDHDNIFTTSGKPSRGPAQFGGLPADRMPPELTAEKPPYDIIMYPTRAVDSGAM
jgi:hypothetical protein